ncbi:MAG TPA: hypothetical protein PKE29_13375 [Phycisphaerales bacterium]|nr:hypothetical protein [Phycisphaerales bacterium]
MLTAWPDPKAPGGAAAVRDATVPTLDRSDQAHQVRGADGLLVCADRLDPGCSHPRRYPKCQMTSRGVSFDSSFDELHRRLVWLESECGLDRRRSLWSGSSVPIERIADEAYRRAVSIRDLSRQRLSVRVRGRRVREPSLGDSAKAVVAYAEEQIKAWQEGRYVAPE